jgi:hypothetical protein
MHQFCIKKILYSHSINWILLLFIIIRMNKKVGYALFDSNNSKQLEKLLVKEVKKTLSEQE